MPKLNREALEKPFDQVKYRDGRGGKRFAYLEGYQVVQRIDQVFDGQYDFHVIKWEQVGTEVIVHAAITVQLEDGAVIRKENIGSAEIQADRTTGELKDFGDSYKSAVTDAFKRIAAFGFGVGLYLYAGDEPAVAVNASSTQPANHSQTSIIRNTLSAAQKNAILAIGKAKNLGPKALDELAVKQFGDPVDGLNKSQASQFIQLLQVYEQRKAG